MFVDPIIMQFPENLDPERFVIATCGGNKLGSKR